MSRLRHQRVAAGFTLLEVLIAVSAFALVLAAINAVFYGALRLRNKAAESIEESLPRQRTVAVIKRDLANLAPPGGTLVAPFQTSAITNLVGGLSSPDFYTTTGPLDETSPWADIQKVSYILVESNRHRAGFDLIRAVTRNLLPADLLTPPRQQWLMDGVQTLRFLYWDGIQWRDSWDANVPDPTTGATNTLPQAIKVQIQLAESQAAGRTRLAGLTAPIELVVPVVVQARTNRTNQGAGG